MESTDKIGIVLEGGGAKGAYQIGVLRALKELSIKYDCVVGTSIGAVNGAAYVMEDYEEASCIWNNVDFSFGGENTKEDNSAKSYDFNKIRNNIDKFERIYLKSEGIDAEPIIEFYKKNINEKIIRNSNIEFGFTTYCLTDKKPMRLWIEDIPEGMLHEFIFASCTLPVFTPRQINGKYYLDGSLFERLPVDMAEEKNCNIIITVRLRPDKFETEKYKNVKIIDIAPNEYLGRTLEASKEKIKWMIDTGYEDAVRILNEKFKI